MVIPVYEIKNHLLLSLCWVMHAVLCSECFQILSLLGLEKKMLSGCLGELDFLIGQKIFILTCLMGKGPGKWSAS